MTDALANMDVNGMLHRLSFLTFCAQMRYSTGRCALQMFFGHACPSVYIHLDTHRLQRSSWLFGHDPGQMDSETVRKVRTAEQTRVSFGESWLNSTGSVHEPVLNGALAIRGCQTNPGSSLRRGSFPHFRTRIGAVISGLRALLPHCGANGVRLEKRRPIPNIETEQFFF
ncbi:hypothetical protein O4G76_08865 [Limimaricola sp. G21655-S1]|uniref:hypothetical protein n=1 Tax=Limimaricola sp. G21655-S1 TaxID=3014768 RepID=UPI0022AEF586|nr:hypothetical protein [Limimaricola sp. G21655-S1]MCZ4260947.1 hypothetical protein [Limimaricola sp. G21655-S1]